MKDLYTIGYEGLSKEDFVHCLKRNHISILVDVREIPLSRKKGFSKSALAENLIQNGIKYIHIKKLGSPSPIRNRLKEDHNYETFFREYTDYIIRNAKGELNNLYEIATHKKSCLMCYEKDANLCHRNIVAKKVSRLNGTKMEVHHI